MPVAHIQDIKDTGPQQISPTNSQHNATSPTKQAMPSLRSNEKNKISKANRPQTRLCDRRLTKMQASKTPPRFVLQTKRPLSQRNPDLALKISQMRLTIAPIVHVVSGAPAPDFPHTMLSLFTLTEAQLDALAAYYSQAHTPTALTYMYPQTMEWDKAFLTNDPGLPADCQLSEMERLKIKMRMFARFIGMRGADTPSWEYERRVEILGNRVARVVREEEDESLREKTFRGLTRY